MRFTSILVGAFMVTTTGVLASPSPIPGYEIGPVTWTIPNGTDGTFIELQGTIQEVDAQLTRDHPHIKRDLVFEDRDTSSSNVSAAAVAVDNGVPSQDWREHAWCPDPGCCGYADWRRANVYWILDGIKYLQGFKNSIGVKGPNMCGRVSCSYNSAIFMCNDYRNYLAFDNGKPLAFAANKVAANCLWRDPNADPAGSVNQVLGQLWSDDNARGEYSINVIHRNYLAFPNGKPFDVPTRQLLRDCIHEAFDALGQIWSDDTSEGAQDGINILVRYDKC